MVERPLRVRFRGYPQPKPIYTLGLTVGYQLQPHGHKTKKNLLTTSGDTGGGALCEDAEIGCNTA